MILAGIAATFGLYGFMKLRAILAWSTERGILGNLPAAAVAFLLLGGVAGLRVAARPRTGGSAWRSAYGGIAVGVVLWAMLEDLVFRRFGTYPIYEEHNLFPVEIIMLWVVAAIPMAAGIGLVHTLLTAQRRHHDTR